ncbi:hypothetical protein [Clostridium drakei]|nr:hypothetical protein [Clostridium drakei]
MHKVAIYNLSRETKPMILCESLTPSIIGEGVSYKKKGVLIMVAVE